MPKPKSQKSSGARMRAAGLVPVQLWITPEQRDRYAKAAQADGRRHITLFVIHYADKATERIIGKKKAEENAD